MEILVNLKQFRQNRKITQKTAAEKIGIDQRQWNRYENGKNDIPLRYLIAICKEYNVTEKELYEILGLNNNKQNENEETVEKNAEE